MKLSESCVIITIQLFCINIIIYYHCCYRSIAVMIVLLVFDNVVILSFYKFAVECHEFCVLKL